MNTDCYAEIGGCTPSDGCSAGAYTTENDFAEDSASGSPSTYFQACLFGEMTVPLDDTSQALY